MISELIRRRRERRELDAIEEHLLWIVCSPRSGSTWLLNLLGLQPRVVMVDEPHIGMHLGLWSEDMLSAPCGDAPTERQTWAGLRAGAGNYFFAESFRGDWAPHLRSMMLARFAAHARRYGDSVPAGSTPVVCIKEPMGAQGADLALSVIPRARMLHLVRDPRDVVTSLLDAHRPGSWLHRGFPDAQFDAVDRAERVRQFALRWRVRTEVGFAAYDAHAAAGRFELRYEDLRADPEGRLAAVCDWAGLPDARVAEFCASLDLSRVAPDQQGDGYFHRKAQPGQWQDALSLEEVRVIEQECAAPMARLGYEPVAAAVIASAS